MRVKQLLFVLVLLVALCVPALGFDASVPENLRNAILFSWDGVQREHLIECLSRGELHNLAALIKEGNVANIEVTGHQTATKPGHVQMLTGYDPDVTGTKTNAEFKIIPKGLSVFERLEDAFGSDKIATIMITGCSHHIGDCPPSKPEEIEKAKAELAKGDLSPDDREKRVFIIQNTNGEPFYNVTRSIDFWDGEQRRYSDINGPIMLQAVDKYGKGRFFAFFHFRDPDHEGHTFGENSEQYTHAIIDCDKWLGEIVRKLKDLGVYDKTMVFVTSDHGFDEGKRSHSNAPQVVLAANLKTLRKSGDQRDITPTILAEMGVNVSKLQPKYKGVVLTAQ